MFLWLQLRARHRGPRLHARLPFASRYVERFKLFARISQRPTFPEELFDLVFVIEYVH